jgi:hypothetical protein
MTSPVFNFLLLCSNLDFVWDGTQIGLREVFRWNIRQNWFSIAFLWLFECREIPPQCLYVFLEFALVLTDRSQFQSVIYRVIEHLTICLFRTKTWMLIKSCDQHFSERLLLLLLLFEDAVNTECMLVFLQRLKIRCVFLGQPRKK